MPSGNGRCQDEQRKKKEKATSLALSAASLVPDPLGRRFPKGRMQTPLVADFADDRLSAPYARNRRNTRGSLQKPDEHVALPPFA